MKAVKGNKEYTIDETQQKFYQDGGFDIIGDDGTVAAYGRGKTVSYEEHAKLIKENERLHAKVAELETGNPAESVPPSDITPEQEKKEKPSKKASE